MVFVLLSVCSALVIGSHANVSVSRGGRDCGPGDGSCTEPDDNMMLQRIRKGTHDAEVAMAVHKETHKKPDADEDLEPTGPTDKAEVDTPFPKDAVHSQEAEDEELRILDQLVAEASKSGGGNDDQAKFDELVKQLVAIETRSNSDQFASIETKSSRNGDDDDDNASVNVYFDGMKATPVPRSEIDGFAAEMLYSFPATRFTRNETHVLIPISVSQERSLHGTFVRDMHVVGSYEYGLAEWRWGPNPMSAYPDIVAGAAEKLRTFSHDGAWPRTNLDRVKTEISERWRATNSLASSVRRTKSFTTLMAMGTSGIGNDLRDAGVDMNHAQKLAEFIAQDDGQPNDYIRLRVAALQSNLTAKAATAGSSASSFASNCFHLGRNLGIQVVSDGIWVPLGKKLPTYKGQTVFSPLQRFSVLSGISVWEYDPSSDAMRVYYGVSSFLNVVRPDLPQSHPTFFVGPADGRSMPLAPEGRSSKAATSTSAFALWHAAHRIPTDYQYLYQDEATLCPPEKLQELEVKAEQFDFATLESSSTLQKARLLNHALDAADCGITFLRGSESESNGLEIFELAVLIHFMMEVPASDRIPGLLGWKY